MELKATIAPDGTIRFDATGMTGATEEEILETLNGLNEQLTGDPSAFRVEKHVHTHATAHAHSHAHSHAH